MDKRSAQNRTAIRPERSALGCIIEYRARTVDTQPDSVLLRFEITHDATGSLATGCLLTPIQSGSD